MMASLEDLLCGPYSLLAGCGGQLVLHIARADQTSGSGLSHIVPVTR